MSEKIFTDFKLKAKFVELDKASVDEAPNLQAWLDIKKSPHSRDLYSHVQDWLEAQQLFGDEWEVPTHEIADKQPFVTGVRCLAIFQYISLSGKKLADKETRAGLLKQAI